MAECVISAVDDATTGVRRPACLVHAQWAPCWHNGNPAATMPLHLTMSDRDAALRYWSLRTRQARPLVLHRLLATPPWDVQVTQDRLLIDGTMEYFRKPRPHTETEDCWCSPEIIPSDGPADAIETASPSNPMVVPHGCELADECVLDDSCPFAMDCATVDSEDRAMVDVQLPTLPGDEAIPS